ncbi:MAG TPA: hypothetical protein GX524_01440 [Firmicutes bacterium]|nr:hypothetical protein [Bacillota bacterium]
MNSEKAGSELSGYIVGRSPAYSTGITGYSPGQMAKRSMQVAWHFWKRKAG